MTFVAGPGSLELMIQNQQKAREDRMDSYLDELAAKYTTKKNPRATKRKAPPGGPKAKTSKK